MIDMTTTQELQTDFTIEDLFTNTTIVFKYNNQTLMGSVICANRETNLVYTHFVYNNKFIDQDIPFENIIKYYD